MPHLNRVVDAADRAECFVNLILSHKMLQN